MRLYQPSLMFPSPIKSNLPFTLELQFGIPVPEAEPDVLLELGQPVTYTVECYARSLVGERGVNAGQTRTAAATDTTTAFRGVTACNQSAARNLSPTALIEFTKHQCFSSLF
jgi:hypothetical protein